MSCKRCSVKRVNALCELFQKSNDNNDQQARRILNKLIYLADERGYKKGYGIWDASLTRSEIRSICWNISSLLRDEDLEHYGIVIR